MTIREISNEQIVAWGHQLRAHMKGYRMVIPVEYMIRFGRTVLEKAGLYWNDSTKDDLIAELEARIRTLEARLAAVRAETLDRFVGACDKLFDHNYSRESLAAAWESASNPEAGTKGEG